MLSRNYVFHVGRKSFFKIQSISLVVLPLCPVPVMKINVSSEGDGVGGGGQGGISQNLGGSMPPKPCPFCR